MYIAICVPVPRPRGGGANDIVIYVHDLRLFADMRVVYSLIWILSIAAHSVVAQEIRNDGVSMSVYFDNGFSSVDHGPAHAIRPSIWP